MRPQIKKRANSDYDLFLIYFIYTTLFGKITNPAETDTFNWSVTNWDSMTHLSKSAEVQ